VTRASTASLDEVRAVWETNVFGSLPCIQAMLPLLRESFDAASSTCPSGVGSLTTNADRPMAIVQCFGPIYPASKAPRTRSRSPMMIELESTNIKITWSPRGSPGRTSRIPGVESVENGSARWYALHSWSGWPDGTFTRWENATIPCDQISGNL